jgi:enterochelin esterase-like enzyme
MLRPAFAAVLVAVAVLVAGGAPQGASAGSRTVDGGRLVTSGFASKALGGVEHYAVFLPAGYSTSRQRYPVVYALHGLPTDATGYERMSIDAWGRAAQRAGRPAIVVSPQGARAGDTDPEWHDWGPKRDWETAVAVELVRHVDHAYRTIANRRDRALIGVSAGGYGATLIGLHHPETFSVIQSWSGYFHPTDPAGDAPLDVGSPEENAAANAHTYVPLISRIYRNHKPSYFGFYVGDEDWRFLAENEQLHSELLRAHVPHTYAVYPGGHSGAFWTVHEDTWIGDAVDELAR